MSHVPVTARSDRAHVRNSDRNRSATDVPNGRFNHAFFPRLELILLTADTTIVPFQLFFSNFFVLFSIDFFTLFPLFYFFHRPSIVFSLLSLDPAFHSLSPFCSSIPSATFSTLCITTAIQFFTAFQQPFSRFFHHFSWRFYLLPWSSPFEVFRHLCLHFFHFRVNGLQRFFKLFS